MWSGLEQLQELNLQKNKITVLHGHPFFPLKNLRKLNLARNKIIHINSSLWKGISKEYVASLIGLYKNNGAISCVGNYLRERQFFPTDFKIRMQEGTSYA